MSPRPEERDDVAERLEACASNDGEYAPHWLLSRAAAEIRALRSEREGLTDVLVARADEIDQLRSEREQMAARIAELKAELAKVAYWNSAVAVCREHVEDIVSANVGLCVICDEEVLRAEVERLRAALSEYRGDAFYQGITDERMGVERIRGWATDAVPGAGGWVFAESPEASVGGWRRATLTLRHPTPASEPGPANPADTSPREET
jgi:hypothetical protein